MERSGRHGPSCSDLNGKRGSKNVGRKERGKFRDRILVHVATFYHLLHFLINFDFLIILTFC